MIDKECNNCFYFNKEADIGLQCCCGDLCTNQSEWLPEYSCQGGVKMFGDDDFKSCTTCRHYCPADDFTSCSSPKKCYTFNLWEPVPEPEPEVTPSCSDCKHASAWFSIEPCSSCKCCSNFEQVKIQDSKICTTCVHADLRLDEEPCYSCDGCDKYVEYKPEATDVPMAMQSTIEFSEGCKGCLYYNTDLEEEPCSGCHDFGSYVETDDPKSCHRCIHIGRSYDAKMNKEFCSNCQDFSLFEQDAKQIVFQTQVGGGHYKNPNVPDGFPDPAEFCIVHNLGGAETAVIKYMFRHRSKDGLKDLKKAKQYIEFIAACVYNAVI